MRIYLVTQAFGRPRIESYPVRKETRAHYYCKGRTVAKNKAFLTFDEAREELLVQVEKRRNELYDELAALQSTEYVENFPTIAGDS